MQVHFENEIDWKSLMHLGSQVLDCQWMDAEVCPVRHWWGLGIRCVASVLPIRKYPVVPGKPFLVAVEREGEEGATNDVTRNSRHLYKA